MHTPFLSNRLGRWLAVTLLALMSATTARAQVLFNETFEGTSSFTAVNGTQANKWFVGTVAGNGPTTAGTNAAYISDDAAGATYNYTTGTTSVTHFYRDVTIPAGQLANALSFDWKSNGESTFDYLQVFLVPTTVTPVAGTQLSNGSGGAIQLGGNINLQPAFGRTTLNFPASTAGTTQRLVFTWRNDGSGGTQPPVALDNITVTSAAAVPVCGTKLVGPTAGADYPTLTAALQSISLNGVCGPLVLELQSTYVSSTETFPLVYNAVTGTSATNTVTIRPTAGATGLSLTSAAAVTLNLNGGRYLVLDGRPGGSGTTVSGAAQTTDLIVANTSTSGSALQLINDAGFNTVQHCQVKGVGTSLSSYPDILMSSSITAGNSDNIFRFNNIGDGATLPYSLMYSSSSLNARNTFTDNNLFNFYGASTTAAGLYLSSAGNGWTITNNSVYQTASRASTSTTHYGIYVSAGNGHTVSGNYVGGTAPNAGGTPLTVTGTAAAFRFIGIYLSTSTGTATSVQGNTIGNITWLSSSGATTGNGILAGIYVAGGDANIGTTTGNIIGSPAAPISVSTSTSAGISVGISTASSGTVNIVGNTITNITGVGSSASVASNVVGILASSGTNLISRNKIATLASGSGGANQSTGISLTGGTANTVTNNLIGDLQSATSTSLVAVAGIAVSGGTTNSVYFNTINLSATSSGATFGTSGIFLNSTTVPLDLRNNIVVNKSTAVGAGGYTAALRRISGTAGTAPSNLAATTNANLYYAGTPSATNLIYVEGTTATVTNAQQTLAAYKTFVAGRENNSVTEDVPFLSTTGSSANFLHINPATATQVESGGLPISGITTDFDGDTRNANFPDLGADEGTFTQQDLVGPVITYTPLSSTGSTANRTLVVTISDASGISTTTPPRIFFRKGTGTFVSALATSVSGSTYTFTIDYAALGGIVATDVIQYYVVAQDVPGNVSSNPAGNTFTTPASVFGYTVLNALNGIYYVGTGTSPDATRTYATLTAAANAYSGSGLAGPVTFLLLDNAYSATTGETFPIIFFNNPDASATNTLLIKPNAGASPVVTAAGSVVALASSRYITIDGSNGGGTPAGTSRNLTLTNTTLTANTYSLGLLSQTGQAQANLFTTVRNVNLIGGGATANATYGILVGGVDNDNLTLQNNSIQGVNTGIQAFGSANVSAGGLDNLVISNNMVGPATAAASSNISQYGILVASAISPVVSGNEVQNIVNPTATFSANMIGIVLQDVKTGIVTRNSVHNLAYTGTSTGKLYGISTQISTSTFNTAGNPSANRFDNNLVYALNSSATSASWNTSGINNNGGYGDQYYYNTVYLSGALSAATGTAGSAAFSNGNGITSTAATNIDVRNNIFSIIGGTGGTATTGLYAHYTTLASYAGSTLNNNDLYVTVGATGAARIGRLNGTDATTLADWRTATGQEANSLSVDPAFTQTTTTPFDLTPSAPGLNGAATPIAGVTVDYTGATRGTLPDIGAYEFTPPSCQPAANLAVGSITSTSASLTFSAPTTGSAATGYTVTYTSAGGTPVTVTPTGSPVALSGLAANTVYTVTVTTNCASTTSPGATVTFTTACTPPTYATLPASEDFESTWVSRCNTREVPSTAWLNTPLTGNNSWRRDDDGAAANWTSPASGAFTPAGSRGSSHAARFHSYNASSGAVGTLDFYVDLSAAGPKRLTFDYVNVSTSGSKIEVLLSTDGGATFGATPLLTVGTAAAFTSQTLDLTATSATSVIRFKATSDFGSYDIGVDNVLVRVLPAVDLAASALVAPTATQGCYSSAETVTVAVTNQGAQAIDFTANAATVTAVVATPSGSQTLTGTIATGTLAAGATQNVTLTPTLNMSAVGTYTFVLTATAAGDGNTANDVLTPSPTRTVTAPVAGTLSPANSSLCVSGTAALSLTGAANGSIQYQSSSDNVTFTDISGATSAAYTTPVLTTTTYYRAQVRCGTAVATSNVSTITVTNPLVASTNTPVAICSGSTATLTATASNGSSVRFFDVATGGTALTTTTAGSYTTPALTASATYYAEAYSASSSVAGLADNSASNGTFVQSSLTDYPLGFAVSQAGTLASVDVYPSAAGALTIRLYRTTGGQPAGTTTAVAGSDVTITVTAAQVGTRVTVPLNYALAAGDYRISNFAGTLGRFSTYTGTYPLTSGSLTVKGSYTLASSTSYSNTTYNSFFNLTFNTECASATRTAIQVNVTQPATATFPAATDATCGTSAYQLAGTVGGSVTTGTYSSSGTGTFAPNATTLNATYTPSAADVAAGSVTITLTSAASGPCAAATATLALSISPAPVATFSYPTATTYCAGSTSTVSPTLGTGATAGTFASTAGLTIDPATGVITLSSSTAGTYTVTNTIAASGSCAAATATTTVTITPAASAAFSYTGGTFCLSGTNPVATVTGTTGGVFSSTTGLTINATTGAITLSSSTAGTYVVTYTVAGSCGASSTQTVTITAAPAASFSYGTTPTFCVSGTTAPAPAFGTGASAGTFTSTTGLTINATTGVITLATSTPGTYTVTNTIAANGGCAAATATATVTITAAPTATFSYATTAGCAGSTTAVTPTLGTGASAGTFSSTTGLVINATTGAINLATSTAGTYTVTNTVAANGGCAAATATATFTVNPRPATPTITVVYNGTTTTLTSSATTGNQWYLNGNPITGATGQTYVVNGLPAQYGNYTVTTTNANGCVSLPSTVLVITAAKNGIAGASLQVYPNPTPTGQMTLELTGYRLATQLTVLDALGRVIISELLPANAGTATRTLDLKGVTTGVYLLRLRNTDGVETRRLVRE